MHIPDSKCAWQSNIFKNIGDVSTHLLAGGLFAHRLIWIDFSDRFRVSGGLDFGRSGGEFRDWTDLETIPESVRSRNGADEI